MILFIIGWQGAFVEAGLLSVWLRIPRVRQLPFSEKLFTIIPVSEDCSAISRCHNLLRSLAEPGMEAQMLH